MPHLGEVNFNGAFFNFKMIAKYQDKQKRTMILKGETDEIK